MKYSMILLIVGAIIFSGCDGLFLDLSGGTAAVATADIRSFSLPSISHSAYGSSTYEVRADVDAVAKTITISIPDTTDLSAMDMAIQIPEGAEVVDSDGTVHPFVDENTPVSMTAMDMSTSTELTVRNGDRTTVYTIVFNITPQDYIPIFAEENFDYVRVNLGSKYILMNDIALLANFEPIGTRSAPFTGIFDGNRKTISDLKIIKQGEDGVGFFQQLGESSTTAAEIRNVIFVLADGDETSPSIEGKNSVGAVSGFSYGKIENVAVTGGMVKGEIQVGGLVGVVVDNINGRFIIDSYVTADVMGTSYGAGGLIGKVDGRGTIKTSYASGTITGAINTGGLVGEAAGSLTIERSYMSGTVNGKTQITGGLVGKTAESSASSVTTITESYVSGNVYGSYIVGGLIGQDYQPGQSTRAYIQDCYVIGEVKGSSAASSDYVGGIIGSLQSRTNSNSKRIIKNSYVAGLVELENTSKTRVAAIGGNLVFAAISLDDVYFDVAVTGQTKVYNSYITYATGYYTVDGVVRVGADTSAEAITQGDFSNWDSNIWQWQEGQWPRLQWQGS